MKRLAAVTASLLALLFAAAAPAAADDAGAVLSKYVAWRGGARFEALRSVHERGRIRIGEVDGTFERWLGRDGRLRQNRVLGPLADSEAVTAESNWTTNASGQVEDLGDRGQEDRRAIALSFADLGRQETGVSYSLRGIERQDGRRWTVLRASFGGNDSYDLLLDAKSGELFGERITQDGVTRLVRYSDWRKVAGIRMAFEARTTSANSAVAEHRRFELIEVNPPLAAELFARPAGRQTWAFAPGRDATGWIEFEFFNNDQIFIPASVNGRAVTFVLDSGADITILDQATASQLGVKLGGSMPVGGTAGQATMQLATDIEVRIGELELHGITAGVMDLKAIAEQLGHAMPMIVGKELFNQLIVDIDFPNRRIAFRERGRFTIPSGAVRVALGRHGENRTVPVSIEGRPPVDFDFDLGSNSPLIVYPHYRDSVHLLAGRRHSQGLSAGVGGLFRPICATLTSIAIAGLQVADVPADFPEPANSTVNSDRMGGNIGLPVFSRFRMLTDYAADNVWLVGDSKALAEPFPRNRAGLITFPSGDRLKVLMVAPGSPAEQGGWKENMEIVAIDGHRIDAAYRSSALSRWANQAAGTRVALTLADNSAKELVLADYF